MFQDHSSLSPVVGPIVDGFFNNTWRRSTHIISIQQHGQDIAAVVLDVTMPGMSGEETLRHLKSIQSGVKVILSSGYNEVEITNRFVGKGLAAFIQKPYSAAALVQTV